VFKVAKSAQGGQECSIWSGVLKMGSGVFKVARKDQGGQGEIKVARRDQVARCDEGDHE
jgi:hypothetical protein